MLLIIISIIRKVLGLEFLQMDRQPDDFGKKVDYITVTLIAATVTSLLVMQVLCFTSSRLYVF
jgi:hypothetical protein